MRLASFALVLLSLGAAVVTSSAAPPADGNRLAYLDDVSDPYYVGRDFPKLTTPQWVGETEVRAVVVLAVDGLRATPGDVERYEAFIRPILERLERIDGRASISIMASQVDPRHPQLRRWLTEGVGLDAHTWDHRRPPLKDGDLATAKAAYDGCIDALAAVPGNVPVAFRTPGCDARNTVSPRFFAEVFNQTTPGGHFLQIDSSVFNVTTSKDASLPRELTTDAHGRERFGKYLPTESFVVEDYPYPYLVNRLCWQFPCAVPSDGQAQHLHGPGNLKTLDDRKAQLDAAVIKEGVFNFVISPDGGSSPRGVVDFIDYAVATHGRAVKFLTFRECLERLNLHLLENHPVRDERGRDNGARLIDLNGDGYLDVVTAGPLLRSCRIWQPAERSWRHATFPTLIADRDGRPVPLGYGVVGGRVAVVSPTRAWFFDGVGKWTGDLALFSAEPGDADVYEVRTKRLRDLDDDGSCELLADLGTRQLAFRWDAQQWVRLPFDLPADTPLVTTHGGDAGVRFIDLNEDGRLDLLVSTPRRYAVHLFDSMRIGWAAPLLAGPRGQRPAADELPPIVRDDGTNSGFFAHARQLVWQNEDTAKLPHLIDQRRFDALLVPKDGLLKKR